MELPGKGVRFIAHQGALDAAGQPHGQQAAQHRRHHAHSQQPQGGTQPHQGHTAEIDPHDDKADHFPRLIPHRGIGGVVGAHGAGFVGGIGGGSRQGIGLGDAGIGRAYEGPVGHVDQGGLGVPHQNQVDVRRPGRGLVQIIGQFLHGICPLQGFPEQGHPGEDGGRVEQIVVQRPLLTAQGEIEGPRQREGNGHNDDDEIHPHEPGADGSRGLYGHEDPPPLLSV